MLTYPPKYIRLLINVYLNRILSVHTTILLSFIILHTVAYLHLHFIMLHIYTTNLYNQFSQDLVFLYVVVINYMDVT